MATATTMSQAFPPAGLRITAGSLTLRALDDELLLQLLDLAKAGIHDPSWMPFSTPWTDVEPEQFDHQFLAHHWGARASFKPEAWSLILGVQVDGELVGTQAVTTEDFLVTRTGETGSWLGRAHQGRGIGTLMRQTLCAVAFDHLGFEEVTSGAFTDNPASLAVSRKTGYVPNGCVRMKRRDTVGHNQLLVLTPSALVRHAYPIEVEGVAAFRRFIGLDGGTAPVRPGS